MSSKPERKPGRNDRCWCGSGNKYKNCHLRQDEDAARATAPIAPTTPEKSIVPFTSPTPPQPREPSPEELADQAEWEKFDKANVDGKITFFLERLETGRLDADDAFEAYLQIRDALHPRHDGVARTCLAELIERLRRDAPTIYKDSAVYLEDLITFVVTEERWDALPNLLAEFAAFADNKPDEFSGVMKMMLYHGQTQPLFAAMKSAWHKVSTSHDILAWGVNEYYGTLVELALYQYLETTTTPHVDDPELLEVIDAFDGKVNQDWLTAAIEHLSAPAPSPWRIEDFGAMVDAETWEHNIVALLFDWMADQHRRANVPFSKSDLFKEELQEILHQQISEREPAPKGKHGKSKTKRVSAPMVASPLIPRYDVIERTLVAKFQFLGSEPYEAGALIELLPAYLHFIAQLGLIHPTEMDAAFSTIKPLIAHALKLLDSYGADVHLIHAVKLAWSDATLNALRDDPDLVSARALPVITLRASVVPPTATEAQTYRFKVSYRRADDVWFMIEASSKHSLDDLHTAIIDAADFDDDHLHAFFLSGRAWDKETEYGHGDARYSSGISIGKLRLRLKQRFLYLFDFGDQHEFDVQLIETSPEPPREPRPRPRAVEQHGKMPPQYPNWDDKSEWDEDGEEEDVPNTPNQIEVAMKQAHSNFRVGDCVKVKDRVQDPDFGTNISGWQGRISNIDTGGDEILVSIQWDSITLKDMPVAMIEQCEEQGLDWAEMALGVNDVEPAIARDAEHDIAKIKAQLSNQHGWVSLGEEGKRIQKVLAGVEADDDLDEFGAWEDHLEKNLRFPFEAVIAELLERGPLHVGDKVIVTGIADATDEKHGIIVDLKMGRRKYAFPLCDLEAMDKKSANYQLVKDYAIWFANR